MINIINIVTDKESDEKEGQTNKQLILICKLEQHQIILA